MIELFECQNCWGQWEYSELNPIKDIMERVAPGEPMPAGECPECGALCHPQQIKPQTPILFKIMRAAQACWDTDIVATKLGMTREASGILKEGLDQAITELSAEFNSTENAQIPCADCGNPIPEPGVDCMEPSRYLCTTCLRRVNASQTQ
jgi:hypothetical protein